MKHTLFRLFVFSLLLFPSIGVFAKDLENIHLVWKPTSPIKSPARTMNFVERITVEDFTDARKTPELIGENRQRETQVLRVTTKDNIAAFVTENFRKSLENAGFSTVKSGSEISIDGELIKYFVTETKLYKGEIEIKIRIKDSRGQTLWNGVITGKQDRWGISYKADNYFEVLSDLIINVVNSLIENSETQKAFIKR